MYNCVCVCTHVICSQSISLLTLESSVFPTDKWLVESITPDWRWFPIQVLLKMDKTADEDTKPQNPLLPAQCW